MAVQNTLCGCLVAIPGFALGVIAGLLLAEFVIKPGLDGLVPKLAIGSVTGLVFAVIGFKVGKRAAGRPNPTDE